MKSQEAAPTTADDRRQASERRCEFKTKVDRCNSMGKEDAGGPRSTGERDGK